MLDRGSDAEQEIFLWCQLRFCLVNGPLPLHRPCKSGHAMLATPVSSPSEMAQMSITNTPADKDGSASLLDTARPVAEWSAVDVASFMSELGLDGSKISDSELLLTRKAA